MANPSQFQELTFTKNRDGLKCYLDGVLVTDADIPDLWVEGWISPDGQYRVTRSQIGPVQSEDE
jgi:hypothetical protein